MRLKLTPYTGLWMGNIYKNSYDNNLFRLNLSGLKGSLRWWYEALIRGLGYYACDPGADNACILKLKETEARKITIADIQKEICPACYLFGCNGFASRLQFGNIYNDTETKNLTEIKKGLPVYFDINERLFCSIAEPEIVLLKLIFDFISNHGSIGGRTILKPSAQPHKNMEGYKNRQGYRPKSHVNYGICDISLESISGNESESGRKIKEIPDEFLSQFYKENNMPGYPDLRYFWYTQRLLTRGEFNRVVMKIDYSSAYDSKAGDFHIWLGGIEKKTSKKIFSFHDQEVAEGYKNLPRTWGYVAAGKKDDFESLLDTAEVSINSKNLKWGSEYLQEKGGNIV